jgi:guanylate kinase
VGRFVMLSGPSCVGKGPLHNALKRFHPQLERKLEKLILFNSRAPRPGEQDGVDYHFRPRQEIEALRLRSGQALRDQEEYIVMDVRGDLQALDVENLREVLRGEKDAFFEGNPFVSTEAKKSPLLSDVPMLSVFLSPLSKDEILFLKDPARRVSLPDFVTDVMRRKLLRRTRKQKDLLSLKDLENIERRASSAHREMQLAWHFDYVIPTHDGEDSENWDAFYYPVGDARKALLAFAAILSGQETEYAEKWDKDLLVVGE